MAVTPEKSGPYAPGATIIQVIKRYRDRGLPAPIDSEALARAGVVSDSLLPRVLQTLQTLDLITDNGTPTPAFEGIRKAPEAEYKARLTEWLNSAYADVLQFVDPSSATEIEVRDAFRNYNPIGQQPRMASLFLALYAEAGVRAVERSAQTRPSARTATPRKPATVRGLALKQADKKHGAARAPGSLPPMLLTLLNDLPEQGRKWTKEDRDKVVDMFVKILDYHYKVVEVLDGGDDAEADEAA